MSPGSHWVNEGCSIHAESRQPGADVSSQRERQGVADDVLRLTGRTYLITGAGGDGVGAGICSAIRSVGGRLVVNDVDGARAEAAAQRDGAILAVPGDVASLEDVDAMFRSISEAGLALDGVVNNAGIGLRRLAHEATPEQFDQLMAVDVRGVWLVTRAFVQHRQGRMGPASIVNVASVHAVATMRRFAVYAAAKAGVIGLTRGLAVELGELGIRCNAIAPGFVQTADSLERLRTWTASPESWIADHRRNHQVLDQPVEPIDCGWAAVFLLSDASRSVTGQTLAIDAGLTSMLYEKDFT